MILRMYFYEVPGILGKCRIHVPCKTRFIMEGRARIGKWHMKAASRSLAALRGVTRGAAEGPVAGEETS